MTSVVEDHVWGERSVISMVWRREVSSRARCSPASAGGTLRQFVVYRHLELGWNELRKGGGILAEYAVGAQWGD